MRTPIPDPQIFRAAAIAAAHAESVHHFASPELRAWCAKAIGGRRNTLGWFYGYGEYAAPNHARVITFLWLELLAEEAAKAA